MKMYIEEIKRRCNMNLLFEDYDKKFKTCRYNYNISEWYNNFLHENWEHFKFVHSLVNGNTKYLFSHAGVNPVWLVINGFEEIMDSEKLSTLTAVGDKIGIAESKTEYICIQMGFPGSSLVESACQHRRGGFDP